MSLMRFDGREKLDDLGLEIDENIQESSEDQVPGEWNKVVTWNLSFAENLEPAIDALTRVDELKEAGILLFQEMDEVGVEMIANELGYNYVCYSA